MRHGVHRGSTDFARLRGLPFPAGHLTVRVLRALRRPQIAAHPARFLPGGRHDIGKAKLTRDTGPIRIGTPEAGFARLLAEATGLDRVLCARAAALFPGSVDAQAHEPDFDRLLDGLRRRCDLVIDPSRRPDSERLPRPSADPPA